MMTKIKMNMIQEYTEMLKSLQKFEEENAEVLEMYSALQDLKSHLDQEIKVWAQENGDVENDTVKITVARPYKKWYDIATIKEDRETWLILRAEEAIKKTIEVDKDIIDALVRDEKINRELVAKAYSEEALTPRVSIKIK